MKVVGLGFHPSQATSSLYWRKMMTRDVSKNDYNVNDDNHDTWINCNNNSNNNNNDNNNNNNNN